ncbi:hypothetical protein [Patulibacter sp.]|nr:hypothetical protein [Patulibacter sp.]MDO9408044.1 hypothetical protein [Patulibacter sp.]
MPVEHEPARVPLVRRPAAGAPLPHPRRDELRDARLRVAAAVRDRVAS